jgi:hypothetical protein
VGKGEAILDALLALLRVSLLLLTGAHFSCCEEQEKGKRELGGFIFIQVRSESLACSFFLLQFYLDSDSNSSANLAKMQL